MHFLYKNVQLINRVKQTHQMFSTHFYYTHYAINHLFLGYLQLPLLFAMRKLRIFKTKHYVSAIQ